MKDVKRLTKKVDGISYYSIKCDPQGYYRLWESKTHPNLKHWDTAKDNLLQLSEITDVDQLVNFIAKHEKNKFSIAYISDCINNIYLNSVGVDYVKKDDVLRILKNAINSKGLNKSIEILKGLNTYKNL